MPESHPSLKHEHVRGYFSHSYRPEDKERNLFFWELFNDAGFYFTVDRKPEPDKPKPMYVSYLEWLMRRSTCFIAVIPRRNDSDSQYNCSCYQVFENELAYMVRKPRLIFVEDKLPGSLFRGTNEEICYFHPLWYREHEKEFREKAKNLIDKVALNISEIAQPTKPVALLVDTEQEPYSNSILLDEIKATIRKSTLTAGESINPYHRFYTAASFASEMENFEVLISEVRWPYVPADILARTQERCIPTIRICYLRDGETAEQATQAMHLSHKHRYESWVKTHDNAPWPWLFSGYKLDNEMRPVIFWHTLEQLLPEIEARLNKIAQSKEYGNEVLGTLSDAKKYFLRCGRRDGKVFISNANIQNAIAEKLISRLRDHGIRYFHYTDIEAIPIGTPDWKKAIHNEIRESEIFVPFLSKEYMGSEYCEMELKDAISLHDLGKIRIHPYLVEQMKWPEEKLKLIQGKDITGFLQDDTWVDIVIEKITEHLEKPYEQGTNELLPIEDSQKKKSKKGEPEIIQLDVFLAHNSKDKPQIQVIADKLKRRGIKYWIDNEQIPPGRWFQDVIQQAISNVKSAAIFIGSNGLGKWQVLELRSFITQCINAGIPVIPILLPEVEQMPDDLLFLKEINCVNFVSIDDEEALNNLIWGITGENPDSEKRS